MICSKLVLDVDPMQCKNDTPTSRDSCSTSTDRWDDFVPTRLRGKKTNPLLKSDTTKGTENVTCACPVC